MTYLVVTENPFRVRVLVTRGKYPSAGVFGVFSGWITTACPIPS
ncbi:hypothetical protein [Streptomyces sp. NPDC048508]